MSILTTSTVTSITTNTNTCVLSDPSEDSDDGNTDDCSQDEVAKAASPDDNSSSSSDTNTAKDTPTTGSTKEARSRETTPDRVPPPGAEEEYHRLLVTHTTMVELALKLLSSWKLLKEEFRIPKKQRLQLMREHEREVEAGYRRYLDTERGRTEMMGSKYSSGRRDSYYDSWRSKMAEHRAAWQTSPLEVLLPNDDEFAGLSKEERREKFAQKVAIEDEQRRVQESMWSVHVERCSRSGLDPYHSPIVDPSGQYYWDAGNSAWVPLPPQAYIDAQQHMSLADDAAFMQQDQEEEEPFISPHELPIVNGEVVPPLVVTISLPPHWHLARDQHNRVYFYHSRTRQTQWEIPNLDTKTSIQYDLETEESDSESSSSSDVSLPLSSVALRRNNTNATKIRDLKHNVI